MARPRKYSEELCARAIDEVLERGRSIRRWPSTSASDPRRPFASESAGPSETAG